MSQGNPALILIAGPPLHGKTTVADAVKSLRPDIEGLDVDVVKEEIYPKAKIDEKGLTTRERLERTARAYDEMIQRADALIAQGKTVLCSGTFSKNRFRDALVKLLGEKPNLPHRIFYLAVEDLRAIEERLAERQRTGHLSSITTMEKYRWALSLVEPWPNTVRLVSIRTDNLTPLQTTEFVMNQIAEL